MNMIIPMGAVLAITISSAQAKQINNTPDFTAWIEGRNVEASFSQEMFIDSFQKASVEDIRALLSACTKAFKNRRLRVQHAMCHTIIERVSNHTKW